jgi:hypothetical protein
MFSSKEVQRLREKNGDIRCNRDEENRVARRQGGKGASWTERER